MNGAWSKNLYAYRGWVAASAAIRDDRAGSWLLWFEHLHLTNLTHSSDPPNGSDNAPFDFYGAELAA